MSKNGIFKLLCLVIFMSASALLVKYFVEKEKTKHFVQDSRELLNIARAASELLALWRSGDAAMLAPFCRELFDPTIRYNEHFFRCNPDYMRCLLSQRSRISDVTVEWLRVAPAEAGRPWSLNLKLTAGKHMETLILADSCSMVSLPKRRYAFKAGKEDIRWDNFDREINLDRFPVSWRDIQEWQAVTKVKLEHVKSDEIEISKRHLPAVGLLASEMHQYCRYRGKRLASAPVFEAASYHPRDPKKTRPARVVRTPYPWTIYRKSDFLYRARTKRWKVNREDCRKAFVSECNQIGGIETFTDPVPTWAGIFDTIGGAPEYFDNPFAPQENLFVSHAQLSAASEWHELGKYAHWSGLGFSTGDFSLEAPIQPGFRCMEER